MMTYLPGMTDQKPAFVLIARLKKGLAKPTDKIAPGKNLDDLMRVQFLEGQDIYEEQFLEHYETLTPDRINIWFPFPTVNEVWSASYEAYQINQRRVAQGGALKNEPDAPLYYKYLWDAETKRAVIMNWKHRETGKLVPFDPKVPYEYSYVPKGKKKAKHISLEFKAYGRLKFMVRELDVIGFMELRTTAIGDIRYISSELAGFAEIVRGDPDGLRHIPFVLYRKPEGQNIPGKEMRKTEWYVHLATDPGWVSKKRALALEGTPDPLQLDSPEEPEEPEEIVEGEYTDKPTGQEALNAVIVKAYDQVIPEDKAKYFTSEDQKRIEAMRKPKSNPPQVNPEDPIVRWKETHLAAVVSEKHAMNMEHAREVLNRSELPLDAIPELAVRWAKSYRGLRDEGKTAKQAAGGANAAYKKWVKE